MNTLFQPWHDAQMATLTREVTPPVAPFRYGTDMSTSGAGYTDIADDFGEVGADDYRGLAESLIRRLLTPRGGLIDDPSYGDGIISHLNHGLTVPLVTATQSRIEDELKKDDRVDRVDVSVSSFPDPLASGEMSISIVVRANDRNQDFTLVFAVDGTGHIVDVMVTAGAAL